MTFGEQENITHRLTTPPSRVFEVVTGQTELLADAEVIHVVVNDAMALWIQALRIQMNMVLWPPDSETSITSNNLVHLYSIG